MPSLVLIATPFRAKSESECDTGDEESLHWMLAISSDRDRESATFNAEKLTNDKFIIPQH
jgi:hypothetical protein